jgi:hypothetical protein
MARSLCGPSESPRQPEGEVDEADEDGNFDQWPDDAGKAARRTGGRGFPSDSQQTQRGAAEFAQTQRCGSAEPRQAPTITSLESDRPAAPRAGDADGDEAVASTATGGRALGHGCDRHGVADARGQRGREAGERLYYRSLCRQHPADVAKADGRRARGSRGRLSILLTYPAVACQVRRVVRAQRGVPVVARGRPGLLRSTTLGLAPGPATRCLMG